MYEGERRIRFRIMIWDMIFEFAEGISIILSAFLVYIGMILL